MSASNLLQKPEFPRSNHYDADFVLGGNMGPNPLWLTEWLITGLDIEPEMRVLDLGCGKALSSVFLAREAKARVHAADLWTSPDDNWERIVAAGEAARVTPLHIEAHDLPFARGYFDAVTSIDAYQYFGTDVMYLYYLTRFVRPGGQIGVVVPALMQPFPDGQVPSHLTEPQANGHTFWEDECVSFRTKEAWRQVFADCAHVERVEVDTLTDGWRHWRDHELAAEESGKSPFPSVAETLDRDEGRYLGFVRCRCRCTGGSGFNLYDPNLLERVTNGGG